MITEATTRAEYEAAFSAMDKAPIIGDHEIGRIRVMVNIKRWRVYDASKNEWSGTVKSGHDVRLRVKTALFEWLNKSGIQ